MDIREAVRLAKEGNEAGFQSLYEETYQKSYYVAMKYMKQEDAALDVLQDAYVKAFKNLEQLQEAEKFNAWFARVVATTALDELKKRKVILFSQMETEEDSDIEATFEDDRIDNQPELSYDQAETSRLVQEMISTLSDEQRMCIMMFYVEEMSVKEIAETLGVSENTVKSRLNYGRKNIKEQVLELEKKGTKLYTLAPIPFFLYLLRQDSLSAQAIQLPLSTLLESQAVGGGKAVAAKAGKTIGTLTAKKVVIGAAIGLAVCGGAAAVIFSAKDNDAEVQEVAEEMQQDETQEEQPEEQMEEQQEVVETPEVETVEEEEQVNDEWKEAYIAFAESLQTEGNGYALLDVEGSETPIMVVMPEVFQMMEVSEESCTYTSPYFLELYYYDAQNDEVKQITNAESDSENGALLDFYMETGFYLTYLPNEKLLVGDLVGSSPVIETYSFDVATGKLKAVDTYVDESVDTVDRKDVIYYRSIQQAIEKKLLIQN